MKRFRLLSAVVLSALISLGVLSTSASAATCATLMGVVQGGSPKQYCCTFASQNGTLIGNKFVNAEFPTAVSGADFNLTGPLSGSGDETDIGCSCQATGTINAPHYDLSTSFICAGPDSGTAAGGAGGANGFQNHTAIVGKATATTLKGQMLFNSGSETAGQLYDSVIFSCTTRLNACEPTN
jgi:hypothetical protein